jgi:hypothetical protein
MQKRFGFLLPAMFAVLVLSTGCDKDDDGPCSGVSIVINATVTHADGTANNGRIQANATGSTGFTFSKDGTNFIASGDFTGLAPGTYTITAKDVNGCSDTRTFTVSGTKSYYISRNTWRFSNATVSGVDVSSALQACQKDNTLQFTATSSTGGTGVLDEGPTKCNAGDPQSTPYTWSLQSAETQLIISTPLFSGGSSTFTLVSVTATQLIVSQMITVGGGPQNAVITFIH